MRTQEDASRALASLVWATLSHARTLALALRTGRPESLPESFLDALRRDIAEALDWLQDARAAVTLRPSPLPWATATLAPADTTNEHRPDHPAPAVIAREDP